MTNDEFIPVLCEKLHELGSVLDGMLSGAPEASQLLAAVAARLRLLQAANDALVRTSEADRKDAARGYQQGEQETRTWIALHLGLGNHRFDCPACGNGVQVDEDGCCATCGVDCVEHLDDVDRATIEKALATAQDAAADGYRHGQEELLAWLGGLLGWPDWNRPTRDEIKGDIEDLRADGPGAPFPQRPLLFAIDYDGTWAADPDLFATVLLRLKARGHKAVLVTGRGDGDQWAQEVREAIGDKLPIVFAGGTWKREAAQAAGYAVDVWIDDNPEYVGQQDPLRRTPPLVLGPSWRAVTETEPAPYAQGLMGTWRAADHEAPVMRGTDGLWMSVDARGYWMAALAPDAWRPGAHHLIAAHPQQPHEMTLYEVDDGERYIVAASGLVEALALVQTETDEATIKTLNAAEVGPILILDEDGGTTTYAQALEAARREGRGCVIASTEW